ncbi:hypothetical protein GQ457_01G016950 [Hibiscus cannabinus]
MDFGPRGSLLSSPGSQIGSFRGVPNQACGFGAQDVRMDDRQSFEARTLSVPLTQRSIGDDSITLGPQGGLARGMSFRGPSGISSNYTTDASPASGDSRRVATGMNGFNSLSERTTYGSREDLMPRGSDLSFDRSHASSAARSQRSSFTQNVPPEKGLSEERLYDMSVAAIKGFYKDVERDLLVKLLVNLTRSHDGVLSQVQLVKGIESVLSTLEDAVNNAPKAAEFLATRSQRSNFTQNVPPEKSLSKERLYDMFVAAIKGFYSARDEKEVAWCIKTERDLLAKLLVNLTRSHDGVLSQVQLVKGFEYVLSTLEDVVNDAPKAAEFLGRIFAKLIIKRLKCPFGP